MIDKQEYGQAKLALTIITQNHPNSAKAFYSLAQANAGLGDLPSARAALNQAQALNPTLSFVPLSQVEKLRQAIQPQTDLIVKVEEPSHWFRNLVITIAIGILAFFGYRRFSKPKPRKEEELTKKYDTPKPYTSRSSSSYESPKSYTVYDTPKKEPLHRNTVNEVHHHHHSSSTLETIAAAGITSAAVTAMMINSLEDKKEPTYHSSPAQTWDEPNSWDEPERSNSWDEPTSSQSSSWDDSSSSNDSSWSDSSNNSSSSSWND